MGLRTRLRRLVDGGLGRRGLGGGGRVEGCRRCGQDGRVSFRHFVVVKGRASRMRKVSALARIQSCWQSEEIWKLWVGGSRVRQILKHDGYPRTHLRSIHHLKCHAPLPCTRCRARLTGTTVSVGANWERKRTDLVGGNTGGNLVFRASSGFLSRRCKRVKSYRKIRAGERNVVMATDPPRLPARREKSSGAELMDTPPQVESK